MSTESNAAPAPENESTPPPALAVVPPPAEAAAAEAESKLERGPLNKKQDAQVTKCELLLPHCTEPDAVAQMIARGITAEFLTGVTGKITAARANSNTAVFCTVNGKGCTIDEATAKQELMQALRSFQRAARVTYRRTDPNHLAAYLIGVRIGSSRSSLTQSGDTIINKTNAERPGTVDTAMIVAATAKLDIYKESKTPQTDEKALASAARVARDQLVIQIIADRQQIQLAAEDAWPYTNPANRKMRVKFGLPANRPYTA
jgi:hypothetical protein